MIRLERDRKDPAGAPIRPRDPWTELAREALKAALQETEAHEARREVYGHDRVREALEALFHDKCAYCESKVTAVTDWPVEHFRPKGSVAERPDHPGYYWLAYDWTNLYLSCTLCNERRRDRARWGDCSRAGTGGKADQFPLADEMTRAMSPDDDLDREDRLLLDPCKDDPDRYVTYNALGEIMAVGDNPKGLATISVFHLDRRRLRDLRRSVIDEVVQVLSILASSEILDKARADFESWLRRFRLEDSCEYAAVARAVLRDPAAFGIPPDAVPESWKKA
jgi:uncharacterized protein (TIGR02646 family)